MLLLSGLLMPKYEEQMYYFLLKQNKKVSFYMRVADK
jgi:hypothetical protein